MADELAAYLSTLPEMQHQHGCRSGRHIAALLAHLQHVAVRSHSEIVAIFLDIVGAYDRVGHDILLETMEQFDVPPHIIEFTADFLYNRSFKVRIYRLGQFILSDSTARPHTGLPQGSPLSVLLWHCFCLNCTGGPGWLSGCTLLSHKFQSAGSGSRRLTVFHPGLPTSRRIRIMAVTTERKDGSG